VITNIKNLKISDIIPQQEVISKKTSIMSEVVLQSVAIADEKELATFLQKMPVQSVYEFPSVSSYKFHYVWRRSENLWRCVGKKMKATEVFLGDDHEKTLKYFPAVNYPVTFTFITMMAGKWHLTELLNDMKKEKGNTTELSEIMKPSVESAPLLRPLAESKNCLCGFSFDKEEYCKCGHNGLHCQVDGCVNLLVYGFCYTHSGKALGLEKCPECVSCLIDGKCKNPHAAWNKKERYSELSPGVVIIVEDDGEFDKWQKAFNALAFRKLLV
jgi:hypothetical protein